MHLFQHSSAFKKLLLLLLLAVHAPMGLAQGDVDSSDDAVKSFSLVTSFPFKKRSRGQRIARWLARHKAVLVGTTTGIALSALVTYLIMKNHISSVDTVTPPAGNQLGRYGAVRDAEPGDSHAVVATPGRTLEQERKHQERLRLGLESVKRQISELGSRSGEEAEQQRKALSVIEQALEQSKQDLELARKQAVELESRQGDLERALASAAQEKVDLEQVHATKLLQSSTEHAAKAAKYADQLAELVKQRDRQAALHAAELEELSKTISTLQKDHQRTISEYLKKQQTDFERLSKQYQEALSSQDQAARANAEKAFGQQRKEMEQYYKRQLAEQEASRESLKKQIDDQVAAVLSSAAQHAREAKKASDDLAAKLIEQALQAQRERAAIEQAVKAEHEKTRQVVVCDVAAAFNASADRLVADQRKALEAQLAQLQLPVESVDRLRTDLEAQLEASVHAQAEVRKQLATFVQDISGSLSTQQAEQIKKVLTEQQVATAQLLEQHQKALAAQQDAAHSRSVEDRKAAQTASAKQFADILDQIAGQKEAVVSGVIEVVGSLQTAQKQALDRFAEQQAQQVATVVQIQQDAMRQQAAALEEVAKAQQETTARVAQAEGRLIVGQQTLLAGQEQIKSGQSVIVDRVITEVQNELEGRLSAIKAPPAEMDTLIRTLADMTETAMKRAVAQVRETEAARKVAELEAKLAETQKDYEGKLALAQVQSPRRKQVSEKQQKIIDSLQRQLENAKKSVAKEVEAMREQFREQFAAVEQLQRAQIAGQAEIDASIKQALATRTELEDKARQMVLENRDEIERLQKAHAEGRSDADKMQAFEETLREGLVALKEAQQEAAHKIQANIQAQHVAEMAVFEKMPDRQQAMIEALEVRITDLLRQQEQRLSSMSKADARSRESFDMKFAIEQGKTAALLADLVEQAAGRDRSFASALESLTVANRAIFNTSMDTSAWAKHSKVMSEKMAELVALVAQMKAQGSASATSEQINGLALRLEKFASEWSDSLLKHDRGVSNAVVELSSLYGTAQTLGLPDHLMADVAELCGVDLPSAATTPVAPSMSGSVVEIVRSASPARVSAADREKSTSAAAAPMRSRVSARASRDQSSSSAVPIREDRASSTGATPERRRAPKNTPANAASTKSIPKRPVSAVSEGSAALVAQGVVVPAGSPMN